MGEPQARLYFYWLVAFCCRPTFQKQWLDEEDINNYWMGHQPETMSELYSRLDEDLTTRLREAEIVGVGFEVPAPSAPRNVEELGLELELQAQ
jgi:hypothetical protein